MVLLCVCCSLKVYAKLDTCAHSISSCYEVVEALQEQQGAAVDDIREEATSQVHKHISQTSNKS